MTTSQAADRFRPSGFFTLRSPLLPFDELEAWAADLQAPVTGDDEDRLSIALANDRRRLRERLTELARRPEIREALFLASPSLVSGLDAWHGDPMSKKGRRAEEALVRYFSRMTVRPTPFGLLAGCTTGTVGAELRLRLSPRSGYRRHSRLDMDYLYAFTEAVGRDTELRRLWRYHPNSSLYRAGGRLRYTESRTWGRTRAHSLVDVEVNGYVEQTLRHAAGGAFIEDLAEALVAEAKDEEIGLEESREFIGELIESQILVSGLAPHVTGEEPIHDLITQLREHPATTPLAERLETVHTRLRAFDVEGLGVPPQDYQAVARDLEFLPVPVELSRLFQVDMVKPPAEATLGPEILSEVERGVQLLRRLSSNAGHDNLRRFRQEFVERYGEGAWVPLVAALDEEDGIGFERHRAADAAPLLQGLPVGSRQGSAQTTWGAREATLLSKLEDAQTRSLAEIEISDADLDLMGGGPPPYLPEAFHVRLSVAVPAGDHANGKFRIHIHEILGPSGARLLGRFCHADPELRRRVEDHLREEERLAPEAVFAEVVHLPAGRTGNVLLRPLLRDYEIPLLGRSGAKEERRLTMDDLLVSVVGESIVLHSKRLGREVIPRLTNAHNFGAAGVGAYRFLCHLQTQRSASLSWNWGPLAGLANLPRVTRGRIVLSRARWNVRAAEVKALVVGTDAQRYRATQDWRRRRRLPRYVLLVDGDNELLVDFDNVLSIDAFVALVRQRESASLTELFPPPDELCLRGPEGRFTHEIVIPFVGEVPRRRMMPSPPAAVALRPTMPPGSEWVYAKLYAGSAAIDRILRQSVAPVAREALESGAATRWFFARYGDPQWHLRVRFRGHPDRLRRDLLPRLEAMAGRLMDQGLIWRFQLDTYVREIERYGGAEGIELAEEIFEADSEAVLDILASLEGDGGASARWRLALCGIDRLLSDLGLDEQAKLDLMARMKESFANEFGVGPDTRKRLANRLRRERAVLQGLLTMTDAVDPLCEPGLNALARRSRRLEAVACELRLRAKAGRLTSPVEGIASSFVHMFINRLIRSDARAHEMVLYDFLHKLSGSRLSQSRAGRAETPAFELPTLEDGA
jgi:lantibiotic biosynthesis protein